MTQEQKFSIEYLESRVAELEKQVRDLARADLVLQTARTTMAVAARDLMEATSWDKPWQRYRKTVLEATEALPETVKYRLIFQNAWPFDAVIYDTVLEALTVMRNHTDACYIEIV